MISLLEESAVTGHVGRMSGEVLPFNFLRLPACILPSIGLWPDCFFLSFPVSFLSFPVSSCSTQNHGSTCYILGTSHHPSLSPTPFPALKLGTQMPVSKRLWFESAPSCVSRHKGMRVQSYPHPLVTRSPEHHP